MMVPDDPRDVRVILNLREDVFANNRMLFHLTPFFQGQGSGLLEETRRKPDFSNVVDEPAKMDELLLFIVEAHPFSNVATINSDCRGVASRVTVSRVERCY